MLENRELPEVEEISRNSPMPKRHQGAGQLDEYQRANRSFRQDHGGPPYP
jgi:hypothetical protein